MIELIAVFFMAANISSAALCSEFWMISSVIGSFVIVVIVVMVLPPSRSVADMNADIAEVVHLGVVAGVDHDRGPRILDDGGPSKAMPGSSRSPS